MGDELKSSVTKLLADGSNWVTYRDRLMWAIDSRALTEHLTETTTTATYVTVGAVNGLTPDMRWAIDQAVVKQLIAASVPDSVFNSIKSGRTAKDVWDALKRLFEGRTSLITVDLSRRLSSTHCGEDESVCEHFDKLAGIREQLAAMGKSISNDEFASILMGSLPKSYKPTLSGIAAAAEMSGTTPTIAVITKLAFDEYDNRVLETGKPQDEAFASDDKKKKQRSDVECFNCHKKGHMKSDCWAKGGGKEGQGPKKKSGGSKDSGAKAEAAAGTEQSKDKNADIEAWAAITEDEEAEELPQVPVLAAGEVASVEAELYDSGASRHMSPYRERFVTYRDIPARPITAANNRVFYAVGAGDLQIQVPNGASSSKVLLRDALYAPDMGLTVVSIGRITKAGCSVQFEDGLCKIKRGGSTIGCIPASANGLYKVEHALVAASAPEFVDILTLHRRLGHISVDAIRTLVRSNAVTGLHLIDDFPPFTCDSCEYAKQTRKAIRKEREAAQADSFGAEVHTDVWGPSPLKSLGGRKYYITFTDDYSRYTRLDVLRTKDEAFGAYKAFAAWAKTQHGAHIKRLRSDRGGEYTSGDFTNFLREQGTECRLTTHDTPQHNGVAESLNCRLLERVQAMLHQADLPKNLWAEAIHFAVWLKNRTSTKALGNVTPYERLYGRKPNLGSIPEWGQYVWVHNPKGSKLDARAIEARWVGFDPDSTHAHRIYWPNSRRISVERNVKFVSTPVIVHPLPAPPGYAQATAPAAPPPAPPAPAPPAPPAPPPVAPPVVQPAAAIAPPVQPPPVPPPVPPTAGPSTFVPPVAPLAPPSPLTPLPATPSASGSGSVAPQAPRKPTLSQELSQVQVPPRRSKRFPALSEYMKRLQSGEGTTGEELSDSVFSAFLEEDFYDFVAAAMAEARGDPTSLTEAQSRPDWPRWKEAMDRELATLEKAGTWYNVPRPPDKNIVGSKWVFRVKRKADVLRARGCRVRLGPSRGGFLRAIGPVV